MHRFTLVLIILVVSGCTWVSAQSGAEISDPIPVNSEAFGDSYSDSGSRIATNGSGVWIVVWRSDNTLGGTIGTDTDILYSRSLDNGATWSAADRLNTNANNDGNSYDVPMGLAADNSGNWVVVWLSDNTLGGTIGFDADIFVARSNDNGSTWTNPAVLNSDASANNPGTSNDRLHLSTDQLGTWIATWAYYNQGLPALRVSRSVDNGASWSPFTQLPSGDHNYAYGPPTYGELTWLLPAYSMDSLGGTIGSDWDIVMFRSTDNGTTWVGPLMLNPDAAADSDDDSGGWLATDGQGNWMAVWHSMASGASTRELKYSTSADGGVTWSNSQAAFDVYDHSRVLADQRSNWVVTMGTPYPGEDFLLSRSTDFGATWSDPAPLNPNSDIDANRNVDHDIAQDGGGNWIGVWASTDSLTGSIGTDWDILASRFFFPCDEFSPTNTYSRLLFAPACTQDASTLTQDVFDEMTAGINHGSNDSFYLSAEATSFGPLVVDDAVHINGAGSGLGPYSLQPGVVPPAYLLNREITDNLVPLPAHDVTNFVPPGQGEVLFELLDTQRAIYGNTAVYLMRDCGIYMEKSPGATIRWLSHDVEIEGFQSDLDVVSGMISELRVDQDLSRSCNLGSFVDATQMMDTRADPPVGDGFYYLVSGTCAQPIGYGNASAGPRQGLPPTVMCP